MFNIMPRKVIKEQDDIRKGKGYVVQISVIINMLRSMFLGEGDELNATIMDLEKAYDRVDREALGCFEDLGCGWGSGIQTF